MSGRRAALRALVERRQGLVVPGAYDAVSARLVEQAGFPAVYMTGFGVSAARLGLPDLGFAGLAEMVDQARNLAAAVSIPSLRTPTPGTAARSRCGGRSSSTRPAGVAGSTSRTRWRRSAAATWRASRWCRRRSSSGGSGRRSRRAPTPIS